MEYPKNKQFVKATLKDGFVVDARYRSKHSMLNYGPGFDFDQDGKSRYCEAAFVASWEDNSANDPIDYDLSNPPKED